MRRATDGAFWLKEEQGAKAMSVHCSRYRGKACVSAGWWVRGRWMVDKDEEVDNMKLMSFHLGNPVTQSGLYF